jgi:Protein of unknown function (DUF664)
MSASDLLVDAFDRIRDLVIQATDGLTPAELCHRIDPRSNTVAWLVWHLSRIQDDHVAPVADLPQVWHAQGWAERFALPFDRDANGYGQTSDEVGAVRPDSAAELIGYHEAVHQQTRSYVERLDDRDLDRVVDERWDPPVTLAVRLVSVVSDNLEHVGQAAFIRGIIERST